MTKWSMDDMSLSPMHNVGFIEYIVQSKKYYPGEIMKKIILLAQNKHIKSAKI